MKRTEASPPGREQSHPGLGLVAGVEPDRAFDMVSSASRRMVRRSIGADRGNNHDPAVTTLSDLTSATRSNNDPALGQHGKALGLIGALDDLDLDPAAGLAQTSPEGRPLVAAIGIELEQEREEAEQRAHHQHAAVPILDVGGMDQGVHQQALRIDEQVTLLAPDLLARVVARWVDRAPPFSALFTLWLSMIAAVGLADRSACSRQDTKSA